MNKMTLHEQMQVIHNIIESEAWQQEGEQQQQQGADFSFGHQNVPIGKAVVVRHTQPEQVPEPFTPLGRGDPRRGANFGKQDNPVYVHKENQGVFANSSNALVPLLDFSQK